MVQKNQYIDCFLFCHLNLTTVALCKCVSTLQPPTLTLHIVVVMGEDLQWFVDTLNRLPIVGCHEPLYLVLFLCVAMI